MFGGNLLSSIQIANSKISSALRPLITIATWRKINRTSGVPGWKQIMRADTSSEWEQKNKEV